MAQQKSELGAEETAQAGNQDNLVSMQDASKEKQVLEINQQMSSLEDSITQLNKKLNSTNKQIKTDVTRLSESDSDITEKVAETYKKLGAIEINFAELSEASNKINSDLKKVNKTIKDFEKKSSAALNQAIETQAEVNDEFKQLNQDLVKRAEQLAKKSTSLTRKLNKSIKDNSKSLTELEANIVDELERVARSSQERDDKLDDKIVAADQELKSQKARILLMQGVDEALDKRATSLEQSAQKLFEDTEELKDSTEILNVLTNKLVADVEALELHSEQLAEQNQQQQLQIDGLEEKSETNSRSILALANLEKRHFRVLGSASLLLLLAIVAVFFYQQYQHDTENALEIQRNAQVDQQVSDLQVRVQDEQAASNVFVSEINKLQDNMQLMQASIDDINADMVSMNDQVESLDGRVRYIAPLYNFGSDNTIHGSQWLSRLDPAHYSIKVATVADQQGLYETAQWYNSYFTDDLGYFIDDDGRYTLVYGGRFESEEQAKESMSNMPRMINFEPISAISNTEILEQIQQ